MKRLPLLIAHRGESFDAPENSLAAFDLAWSRGADAIELDIHSSADGALVVCHDADLGRTGGSSVVIRDSQYAEIVKLDIGRCQHVPTLAEVLDRTPSGKRVFVEIKPKLGTATLVADLMHRSPSLPVEVISFHADVCRFFATQFPERKSYFLLDPKPEVTTDTLIATARSLGVAGVNLRDGSWITRERIERFHREGLEFMVWTVDEPRRCQELAGWGVDAITTNRAAWIRESLENPEKFPGLAT